MFILRFGLLSSHLDTKRVRVAGAAFVAHVRYIEN